MARRTLYLDGEYLSKNPGWHVEESPWKASQVLRMLRQNHLAPQTICDVGCGSGEVSDCWSPMNTIGVSKLDPIVARSNPTRRPFCDRQGRINGLICFAAKIAPRLFSVATRRRSNSSQPKTNPRARGRGVGPQWLKRVILAHR